MKKMLFYNVIIIIFYIDWLIMNQWFNYEFKNEYGEINYNLTPEKIKGIERRSKNNDQ